MLYHIRSHFSISRSLARSGRGEPQLSQHSQRSNNDNNDNN